MANSRVLPSWLSENSKEGLLPYYPQIYTHYGLHTKIWKTNVAAREVIRSRLRDWHSMYWDTCIHLHRTDPNSCLFKITFDNILMILRLLWARESFKSELKRLKEPQNQFPYKGPGPRGTWLGMFMTVEDFPNCIWRQLNLSRKNVRKEALEFIEGKVSMLLCQFQATSLMLAYEWVEKSKSRLMKKTKQDRLEIYDCCSANAEFYIKHLKECFGERNFNRFVLVQTISAQEPTFHSPACMSFLRIIIMGAGVPRKLVDESLVLRSLHVHEIEKLDTIFV